MAAKIRVYTREVDPAGYPEGLAGAVHFACSFDGGEERPFNRGYGILFAAGRVAEDNTILPVRVKDPGIFLMKDGSIGICGERILEDGAADEAASGKLLLWKTRDLIRFEEEQLLPAEEILCYRPADTLEVDQTLAERACRYWSPIVCTGVTFPETIRVSSAEEFGGLQARITYSDGSARPGRIRWEMPQIKFDIPGEYEISGRLTQKRYRFPLAEGYGDPVIFPWEGKWYFISTNDNLNDIGIYVREADEVAGLFAEDAVQHLILPFDPARSLEQTFWAPEFHVIGGELYILFAVSGHVWGPQCHMMKLKKGGRITDAGSWEDPVRVLRADGKPLTEDAITLDMTYIKVQTGSYVIWSYREHIGTPQDTGSMLYIATVDEREPWKLTGTPVLLTRPLYGWENVSGTINNEGPYAFIRDGIVHVTYSGGAANGYTYAVGLLTARVDADLTDLTSWTKSVTPVLTYYSVKGEYGPGHNAFYTDEDGELMISYHAETAIDSHLRCDGIRRVHFRSDGTPYFGMSAAEDVQDTEVHTRLTVAP
ncbi:MAG: family 43 glycosylhydrolase [Lachnospiraceae bacterium]|nr:family 43 glycosylhydrolase [Lachnospiraceae bacterium]